MKKKTKKSSKIPTIILIIILVAVALAIGIIYFFSTQREESAPGERIDFPDPIYSVLTGEEISDASLNSSPTFCVQIPNGSTDGARPQVGLTQAGVVFEAIAETGITRFAAIFQNPTTSVIGPIRSLRPYYLDWDTPFDCTVVHAGGSDEALAAITKGGQRNLDENYTYMWRENSPNRLWNNLFTSPSRLMSFNTSHGYNTSTPKTFARLTPEENDALLASNTSCLNDPDRICEIETASEITINFSSSYSHNVHYSYDPATNTYLRSHQDGQPHMSYVCPSDLVEPNTLSACGDPIQIAPRVVAIMRVEEHTMSDNYHESIKTIGGGTAKIFQNGTVITGTWSKTSQNSQIVFRDESGKTIPLAPGQLWISAVPQFGTVRYE